jgi:hypothetical protein
MKPLWAGFMGFFCLLFHFGWEDFFLKKTFASAIIDISKEAKAVRVVAKDILRASIVNGCK